MGDHRRGRGARRLAPLLQPGITDRDNEFYKFWDKLSRDRDQFTEWMQENVLGQQVSQR